MPRRGTPAVRNAFPSAGDKLRELVSVSVVSTDKSGTAHLGVAGIKAIGHAETITTVDLLGHASPLLRTAPLPASLLLRGPTVRHRHAVLRDVGETWSEAKHVTRFIDIPPVSIPRKPINGGAYGMLGSPPSQTIAVRG